MLDLENVLRIEVEFVDVRGVEFCGGVICVLFGKEFEVFFKFILDVLVLKIEVEVYVLMCCVDEVELECFKMCFLVMYMVMKVCV